MSMVCLKYSQKKSRKTERLVNGLFSLLILFTFVTDSFSQEKPDLKVEDFSMPLKKCFGFARDKSSTNLIASDNKIQNVIFLQDNKNIFSYNLKETLINWKTESNGFIKEINQTDNNDLIFISSRPTKENNNQFYLNSVSLKTGITNWQRETALFNIIRGSHKDNLLVLSDGLQKVAGIDYKTGTDLWEITLSEKFLLLNTITDQTLLILTDKNLINLELNTGRILKKTEIPSSKSNNFNFLVGSDMFTFLGTSDGKIFKFTKSFKNAIWKYKTGGSISSILYKENKILVTSLDNFVYLLDAQSGRLKWKKRMDDRIDIKPVFYNNLAVISSTSGNKISIINIDEGKLINRIILEEGNYPVSSPLVLDEGILLATNKGVFLYSSKCQ